MKKVSVEENAWIQVQSVDSGNIVTGKIGKYMDARPFDENNLAITIRGYKIPIRLDQIIRVFPKVTLKEDPRDINPSKRDMNEP